MGVPLLKKQAQKKSSTELKENFEPSLERFFVNILSYGPYHLPSSSPRVLMDPPTL